MPLGAGSICCVFGRSQVQAGGTHGVPKPLLLQAKELLLWEMDGLKHRDVGCDVVASGMAESCKLTRRSLLKALLKRMVGDDEPYGRAAVSYYVLESLIWATVPAVYRTFGSPSCLPLCKSTPDVALRVGFPSFARSPSRAVLHVGFHKPRAVGSEIPAKDGLKQQTTKQSCGNKVK